MQSLKKCKRHHWHRYELGVRPSVEAGYFRLGGVFHKGVEIYNRPGWCGPGGKIADAIAEACQQYETTPAWCKSDEQVFKWMVERETVAAMLAGYFWRWGDSDVIAETIASEQVFEMEIKNPETGRSTPNFKLAGKIDGIVRLKDGRLAVHEIKTTGEDIDAGSDYWKRLRIDSQISTYVHAARRLGFAVETVLYDVAKKPDISPRQIPVLDTEGSKIVLDEFGQRVRTKDGRKWRESGDAAMGFALQTRIETPMEFGARFLADIDERPDHYFVRQEIPRLEADMGEFEQELWDQQLDLRQAQATGRWYRNTNACVGFGKCEYFDVCTNSVDLAVTLPSGFERVENLHPELTT